MFVVPDRSAIIERTCSFVYLYVLRSGYELTEPWMTEDGLPRKGLWNVMYYSGEGQCKKGCKPMVKLRRSMMQLVSNFTLLLCSGHTIILTTLR